MEYSPPDGLLAPRVGQWVREKHARLEKYIDISHAARRKFKNSSYIDLYCNYGKAQVRETDAFVDGNAIVAFKAASRTGTNFSRLVLNDIDSDACDATKSRFADLGVDVNPLNLDAEIATSEIVAGLEPHGLHFAFLDPYNLASLPFSIIERLAKLEHMDMMIHVSRMEIYRNFVSYMTRDNSPLDRFAPGWKSAVDPETNIDDQRRQVMDHWLSMIRALGMDVAEGIELVTGTQKQGLYWLVFVARHELALKFWESIRNVGRQGTLL